MTEETKLPSPSPMLEGMVAYSPPKAGAPVDLRLDGNEGQPPPVELFEKLWEAGPEIVGSYPHASGLEALIAERAGVKPGQVIVTAGGDDAIERAVRAVLAPGRQMVIPVPTFEMFERYARLVGAEVVGVPWLGENLDVDALMGSVGEKTSLVVLVTPNSPTGLTVSREQIERISREASGALVLVDLAYIEFADDDITRFVLQMPNTIVVRSMSKGWGMAGLRVGWAAGPVEVISWLRAAGHPYAVSGPSLTMAEARYADGVEQVQEFAEKVKVEREDFVGLVEMLGAEARRSQANFVLTKFDRAGWIRDAMAGMGIAVRLFPGKEHLEGMIRITMPGDELSYLRLVDGLRTVCDPAVVLLGESVPCDTGELKGVKAERVSDRGLAADRAWMVCGNVDEIRMARSASVLPVGITDDDDDGMKMVEAGAARAVSSIEQIEELL